MIIFDSHSPKGNSNGNSLESNHKKSIWKLHIWNESYITLGQYRGKWVNVLNHGGPSCGVNQGGVVTPQFFLHYPRPGNRGWYNLHLSTPLIGLEGNLLTHGWDKMAAMLLTIFSVYRLIFLLRYIAIQNSLKFVPSGPMNNIPLYEPMMILFTDAYIVTRSQ